MLEKIFRCYGSELTLSRETESWRVYAFLQPDTSRAKQSMFADQSYAGLIPPGQYVFLGPVEPAVQPGDTLTMAGNAYLLHRTEIIYERGNALYQWGLCTRKGGEDIWPNLS